MFLVHLLRPSGLTFYSCGCGFPSGFHPKLGRIQGSALPALVALLENLLCSVGRRYVTRPSSDDEDDGDEKGEEEEGERTDKDEGPYQRYHGLREGQRLRVLG